MNKYYCNNLYLFVWSFLSIFWHKSNYYLHFPLLLISFFRTSRTENLFLNPGPLAKFIIRQDVNMFKPRRAVTTCRLWLFFLDVSTELLVIS